MIIILRTDSKLGRLIKLGKDGYGIPEQNNVVYQSSCLCGKCYIRQTKRPSKIRIDEHKIIYCLMENITMSMNERIIFFVSHKVPKSRSPLLFVKKIV